MESIHLFDNSRSAAHLLFPSGNARRARQKDSGTGRPSGLDDAAAVYAPQSSRAGCCDPAARSGPQRPPPVEPTGRRREPGTRMREFLRKFARNCGGGGSRTRVRKHVPAGLYMRVRFRNLMSGVRKRRKTAGHQTRFNLTATRRAATWPPACLMAFDPQPPGEVKANVTAY
jgi:hypothetical protein